MSNGTFSIKKPSTAIASRSTPATAVAVTFIPSSQFTSWSNRTGLNTKMNGMTYPARASFIDWKPVRIGSAPDRPAAAKEARATGGVMLANKPK